MKSLSREQMKNLMGGTDDEGLDDGLVGECATKKCTDYVDNHACGGNTDCKCQSAMTYCAVK